MNNIALLQKISELSGSILDAKEKPLTNKHPAFPVIQFVARIHNISNGMLRLAHTDGTFHVAWMLLMRPIMLDGIYVVYGFLKSFEGDDPKKFFSELQGDQINRFVSHANRIADWNTKNAKKVENIIKNFKRKRRFKRFFIERANKQQAKILMPGEMVQEMFKQRNKTLFFLAEPMLDQYFLLSKYEHYNVASEYIARGLHPDSAIKLMILHLHNTADMLYRISKNVISDDQLIAIGKLSQDINAAFYTHADR